MLGIKTGAANNCKQLSYAAPISKMFTLGFDTNAPGPGAPKQALKDFSYGIQEFLGR